MLIFRDSTLVTLSVGGEHLHLDDLLLGGNVAYIPGHIMFGNNFSDLLE